MSRPRWALTEIEQQVVGGSAAARDIHSDHSGTSSGQHTQNNVGSVDNVIRLGGEVGSYVEAMDQHFRRHGEERAQLERRVDELQRIVTNREERLDQAYQDFVEGDSKSRQMRRWIWRLGALAALVLLLAGIRTGFALDEDDPSNGSTIVNGGKVPDTRSPEPPVESKRNESDAAVNVVELYFARIRLHDWEALPSMQSPNFRTRNESKDVAAFWSKNDEGLWERPEVVSEDARMLWLRVPYISGRGGAHSFKFVYWALLKDTLLIDKSAQGGNCSAASAATCEIVAPPP